MPTALPSTSSLVSHIRILCDLTKKGNNRRVIDDCALAKTYTPSNIKVYWRAVTAAMKLEKLLPVALLFIVNVCRYDEVLQWCDDGLSVEPSNTLIIAERVKVSCVL
jgi:hypothetical protein